MLVFIMFFFFSSRRRHTRCLSDWSSDVCSSDLGCADQLSGDQRAPAEAKPCPNAGQNIWQRAGQDDTAHGLPAAAAEGEHALLVDLRNQLHTERSVLEYDEKHGIPN